MRHRKARLQLNRFTSWRRATLISLVKNLLKYQSIKTTKARALAVRPLAEKLISTALENTLAAKRKAFKILGDHKLVSFLFSDIGPRFKANSSGHTRILKLGKRRGDNAEIVIFELTQIKKKEHKKPKKTKAVEPKEDTTLETVKEKPPVTPIETQKPSKKFLGGLRKIFKKERDSL